MSQKKCKMWFTVVYKFSAMSRMRLWSRFFYWFSAETTDETFRKVIICLAKLRAENAVLFDSNTVHKSTRKQHESTTNELILSAIRRRRRIVRRNTAVCRS